MSEIAMSLGSWFPSPNSTSPAKRPRHAMGFDAMISEQSEAGVVALTPILQHGFERNQGVPRAGNRTIDVNAATQQAYFDLYVRQGAYLRRADLRSA
jgi:hypothetical protein